MIRFHVSIHDVMPETLDRVDELLERLWSRNAIRPTLLVVPGRGWREPDLRRLRDYAASGCPLAGHGWTHSVTDFRGLRHRLHALLISRRAGEHLALDAAEIRELIRRCRQWFSTQNLPAPDLYVPPAWALGRIPRSDLGSLGFRYVETLGGVLDTESGRFRYLPVVGFEADTVFRAVTLRALNLLNLGWGHKIGVARLALHPQDRQLRLGSALDRLLDGRLNSIELQALTAGKRVIGRAEHVRGESELS